MLVFQHFLLILHFEIKCHNDAQNALIQVHIYKHGLLKINMFINFKISFQVCFMKHLSGRRSQEIAEQEVIRGPETVGREH